MLVGPELRPRQVCGRAVLRGIVRAGNRKARPEVARLIGPFDDTTRGRRVYSGAIVLLGSRGGHTYYYLTKVGTRIENESKGAMDILALILFS